MTSRRSNPRQARGGSPGEREQAEARAEFIVQGPEVATEAFEVVVASNPMIEVIRKVANDVLVLNMAETDGKALKSQFRGLRIEPNQDLKRL